MIKITRRKNIYNVKYGNKSKELIKDILLYIGFILIVSGYIFRQTLSNLDEVWVYNFARCIANRTFAI